MEKGKSEMPCEILLTFSAIDWTLLAMMPNSSTIFTTHDVMMQTSAALRQSVLVI